jgi:hypothetical protein
MSLTLRKGATALSRANGRSLSSCRPILRLGIRSIQVKAAPRGQLTTVNGVDLPISSTSDSAASAGKLVFMNLGWLLLTDNTRQMPSSTSSALHTRCFQFLFPRRRTYTLEGVPWWDLVGNQTMYLFSFQVPWPTFIDSKDTRSFQR